jgi:hypothetical protein
VVLLGLERVSGRSYQRQRVRPVARDVVRGKVGMCGDGGRNQPVSVSEPCFLGGQICVLTRKWRYLGDLHEPQPQQIRLLRAFPRMGRDLGELGLDHAQCGVQIGIGAERACYRFARVAVQRLALSGRPEQPALVALPVHGNQVVRQFGQGAHRHRTPADVGARPALGGHGSGQQEFAVVDVGSRLGSPRGGRAGRIDPNPTFHDRLVRTRPYRAGVSPAAHQQAEPGDHHGLSGAGFTGDDRETRAEFELGVLDDTETADPEVLEHVGQPTRDLSPHRVRRAGRRASPRPEARTWRPVGR